MKHAQLGILMLDTDFSRPIGDIGHPQTFSFPVTYALVKGATSRRVVDEGDRTLLAPFVAAGKKLEQEGVKAITTSCGFLALFQQEIQKQLNVPFFSSSLMQIPLAHTITGGKVAVVTARKAALTPGHFEAVGVQEESYVIAGMDNYPHFTAAIMDGTEGLNQKKMAEEVTHVVSKLVTEHPEIKALVLECTNLPPYKEELKKVIDVPVFDIVTLSKYVHDVI